MKTYELSGGGKIPALGLGTWKAEEGVVETAIAEALDIGYRHIDCASIYGNEKEIGRALRKAFEAGSVTREELWITSKLWNDSHREADVRPALERTLSDLQLDYLDLYLVHWPIAMRQGVLFPEKPGDFYSLDEVPLEETWRAMEACVDDGLSLSIGVSNFSTKKLAHILELARIGPAMNQIEAHPFLQQNALIDYCRDAQIQVTAYSPLGSRDRPPVLRRAEEPSLLEHPVVAEVAEKHGLSPAQVLIGWSINRGNTVIPKSTNPQRLRENFDATEVRLDADDMTALGGMDRHFRYVLGEFWVVDGAPYTLANIWDE